MRCEKWPHLDKSDFALANVTVGVLDGYFSVVLYAALPAQDVVDAGGHLVPLIMVPKSVRNRIKLISSWMLQLTS